MASGLEFTVRLQPVTFAADEIEATSAIVNCEDVTPSLPVLNNADPFADFDTNGEMFGIGYNQEPRYFLGLRTKFRRTTGYFIIYFTGPRKELQYPVSEEVFKLIERQMREQNSILSKVLGPGA